MGARLTRFALTNLENFHRSSFFFLVEVEVTLSVISLIFMHLRSRSMQKASDMFNCSLGVTNSIESVCSQLS